MGFFDFLKRTHGPEPPPQAASDAANRRFHGDRSRMFDLEKTGQLHRLFDVPRDRRDAAWYSRFWDTAWCASVALAHPNTFTGPDGFRYLRLDIPRPGPFESQSLANLAGDCLEFGTGAAFFASPDDPPEAAQYVLSMGVIDGLTRYDSPDGDPLDRDGARPDSDADFDVNQPLGRQTMQGTARQVLVGTPSADYLPPYAAAALARHLEQVWAMQAPRVTLLVDLSAQPHRHLVIGRKRSEFAFGVPIDDMARALTWYLPPGRSIVLMPEDWDSASMTLLRQLC